MIPTLVALVRAKRLSGLRAAARAHPAAATSPQLVNLAAGMAWTAGLAVLVRAGADLNRPWRGYRPLHALIQQEPHADGTRASRARLACLAWMLAHGADPELTGAWPPARALIVAAFTGERRYVDQLISAGAAVTVFAAAALGDTRRVRRALARDSGFALARDEGGLTALQCCAGSRLGAADRTIQRALLRTAAILCANGADPLARTKSWSHQIDAAYLAVSSGHRELFDWLLAQGADADAALVSTLWRHRYDWAEAALAHGARPDRARDGDRPLLNNLIRWGQVEPALWLLARGASPNIPDPRGLTALHQALSRGNARLIQAVVDAGGDLTEAR